MKIMRDANTFLFLLLTLPLLGLGITWYVKLIHSACIYGFQFREWRGTCMFEGIMEWIFTSVVLSSKHSFCLSQEGELTWHTYQKDVCARQASHWSAPALPLCLS